MEPEAIEQAVFHLSLKDRAQLARKLQLSLNTLSDEELEGVWLTEGSRRARELDGGEVQPVPADEVRRKVRALLR